MIEQVPLSSPYFSAKVEAFLKANGLRMEPMDAYFASLDEAGEILAGAGIAGDVLKCMAVSEHARSEGLLVPLVSRLVAENPEKCLKVFTKPEYQPVFESLGFHLLASAPLAVLLERGRGLEDYCDYLRASVVPGRCGVVVMNANPFTLGHRYLLEEALKQVAHLYVIPVKEDVSEFPYSERLEMIRAGSAGLPVTVLEGSPYVISAATFPTYFLKDLSQAAETQMQLDLDLFHRRIAPALGNPTRFVGSEPLDPLTAQYNALMPLAVEIPRLKTASSGQAAQKAVSASSVRAFLAAGQFRAATALCPRTSWPYLLAALAERALRLELDTALKPGLVGPDGPGAHRDMDHGTMLSGIRALRPFWSRMAVADSPETLRLLGIEAEDAMLAATGSVNTHRGAIFCFGLVLNAFARGAYITENEKDIQNRCIQIATSILRKQLNDNKLLATLQGARRMALSGYALLFKDWLPFYRSLAEEKCPMAKQRLLLRIMSTLVDSCILKRAGETRAREVKMEAEELQRHFTEEKLKTMCIRYAQEGISPGGAADMLALTIFIDSITK